MLQPIPATKSKYGTPPDGTTITLAKSHFTSVAAVLSASPPSPLQGQRTYYFFRQVYYILFIYLAVSVLSCVMQDLLL